MMVLPERAVFLHWPDFEVFLKNLDVNIDADFSEYAQWQSSVWKEKELAFHCCWSMNCRVQQLKTKSVWFCFLYRQFSQVPRDRDIQIFRKIFMEMFISWTSNKSCPVQPCGLHRQKKTKPGLRLAPVLNGPVISAHIEHAKLRICIKNHDLQWL